MIIRVDEKMVGALDANQSEARKFHVGHHVQRDRERAAPTINPYVDVRIFIPPMNGPSR
jgi:hypothetical protein